MLENQKLESGLSHSTIIKMHNILHESLQQAVMAGKILNNPCSGVKRCREQYKEIKVLKVDATNYLLDKAKLDKEYSEYYPLWFTEANTGVRRGENLAIMWSKVNLDELTILIDHSVGYLDKPDEKGKMIELKEPKTKGSKRYIAITPSNAIVLREHRRQQNEERLALGLPSVGDNDFVFSHRAIDNKPYLPNTVTHAWIKFVKKYGYAGIRLHDLRHSYATNLIDNGVPAAIVARQLGHTSTRMTDRYTHIGVESLRKASAVFESLVTVKSANIGENARIARS
jgi:integrase